MQQTFSPLTSEQGFTLVEILIAIVLLSFLMIGVYTITDNSTSTIARVTHEDADYAQVGTVINRLEMDFSQLYSPLYFSSIKKSTKDPKNPYATKSTSNNKNFPLFSESGHPIPLIEQPSSSELIFFTSSNRKKVPNSKESHFSWVYYRLRSMPQKIKEETEEIGSEPRKGEYQLIRKSIATNPYSDDLDWDKTRAQPLLNFVKDFKIFLWSPKKEKFVESLTELDNKLVLRAVKVVITRYDANNQLEEISQSFRPLWPNFNTALDQLPTTNRNMPKKGEDERK